MGYNEQGANFQITVDGVPRSYRDDPKIAMEAAEYLKKKNPKSTVSVRDIRNNVVTPIEWQPPITVKPNGG